MSEQSPEQTSPVPEAINPYAELLTHVLDAERARTAGGAGSSVDVIKGFLEASPPDLPPSQLDALGSGLVSLRRAEVESDYRSYGDAIKTMNNIGGTAEAVARLIGWLEGQPEGSFQPEMLARSLRTDVYEPLLETSVSHRNQSEVAFDRYEAGLPESDRQFFSPYQTVRPLGT